MMLAVIWGIWLLVNLFVFALYGADKQRAKRGAWRIPEKTLLLGTWLLGGVTGSISFDEIGDANKDMAYIKKANTETGAFDFVKTQTVAELQ